MDTDSPPANRNRLAWIVAVAIVLLILVGAGAFFGSGQSLWFEQDNAWQSVDYPTTFPLTCYELRFPSTVTREEYVVLRDLLSVRVGNDDATISFADIILSGGESANERAILHAKPLLELRPYVGWPGGDERLKTTPDDLLRMQQDEIAARFPHVKITAHPKYRQFLEEEFSRYGRRLSK